MNRKLRSLWLENLSTLSPGLGTDLNGEAGVEVTLHEKIGAHNVTVVKINDVDHFIQWVDDFINDNGIKNISSANFSPEFRETVVDYLDRNIRFFVFDIIEATSETQTVNPLVYSFESDHLYYPLKLTASSGAGVSYSQVKLFLITPQTVNEKSLHSAGLHKTFTYGKDIKLLKYELMKISKNIYNLFRFDFPPYVTIATYYGYLNKLDKDLVIHKAETRSVKSGKSFEISFGQTLHPGYDWILKDYDKEYIEFLGEDYKASPSGMIGTTTKVFTFKALKKGKAEILFANCELDIDGNVTKELKEERYLIKIY